MQKQYKNISKTGVGGGGGVGGVGGGWWVAIDETTESYCVHPCIRYAHMCLTNMLKHIRLCWSTGCSI